MPSTDIYIGSSKISNAPKEIKGALVQFENENYYKISNYDAMRPFFMSIVSDSNHWMFISSNGGLSAGRKNSESALFPYYTDDKLTELANITGSKTIFQVHAKGKTSLWEPFSDGYSGIYKLHRNIYKNSYGNKVVFEEVNEDLGLTFRYQWSFSSRYGFVKRATVINTNATDIAVTVLDGIQNIMPYGIDSSLQNESSNLVDAYKKNELEAAIGLGIYALSAIIVDKAEPSEALKSTTVWSSGFKNAKYLLSSLQLNAFRKGQEIVQEVDIKAEKGAYFVHAAIQLKAATEKSWMLVAEVNQSKVAISKVSHLIKTEKDLHGIVQEDVARGSRHLLKFNGAADGIQLTGDKLRNTRHFANTLFNIMRGGIFDHNYEIEKSDFLKYLQKANTALYQKEAAKLKEIPTQFTLAHLRKLTEEHEDIHFKRLAYEYMPLKFSRRHGDPSRPWNKFSINTETEDGKKILDYEGNWRDIFQNWEALVHSYPAFIESMIHKFLNATTFDGYNPYRVTKDGFDWETIEPDDPWSYIGYWGDHQIIYLLKLLEFLEHHYPKQLASYFDKNIFVYANVPYKIKKYEDILENPKDTIVFDEPLDAKIKEERQQLGADATLLKDKNGTIYNVNLLEKLLATVLAKVSNFIPEGGIWMNTQRPEWNDANNALVGNGVSMVTLYYLRRFLNFFEKIVENTGTDTYTISEELLHFFNEIQSALVSNQSILSDKVSDLDRKKVVDSLGKAGSAYRNKIYAHSFSTTKGQLNKGELLQFIKVTLGYLDHSIDANKRADNLFHSYNLMTVEHKDKISISYLSEMLEGQVAVLSSGYISSTTALEVLDALKNSKLFRNDQYSYILYPNKELSRFLEKNSLPANVIEKSALVKQLLKDGNAQIIEQDIEGRLSFNGLFNNVDSLKEALSKLCKETYKDLIEQDSKILLDTFEEVFNHKAFTGRSGTFFGYEGLGSIYWHMVSKLLLSTQENCIKAIENNESAETIGRLMEHYYEINAGIGVDKSPELYGAFPTDPYSHTPGGKGAQQPGMTGQVKEDVLSRFGELGVFVRNGKLKFNTRLLRKEEFIKKPTACSYTDVHKEIKDIQLEKDSLFFTYCQIPIVYTLAEQEGINVISADNKVFEFDTLELDAATSDMIFKRTGEIEKIHVAVKK